MSERIPVKCGTDNCFGYLVRNVAKKIICCTQCDWWIPARRETDGRVMTDEECAKEQEFKDKVKDWG